MIHISNDLLTAVFWAVYVLAPLATIAMLRASGFFRHGVSMTTIIVGYYWLVAFSGYALLFTHWSEYRATMGVLDQQLIARCMFFSATTMLLLATGMLAAYRIAPDQAFVRTPEHTPLQRRQLSIVAGVLAVVAVFTYTYLKHVPAIALLVLIRNDGDPSAARSLMTNAFSGPFPLHYFQLAFQSIAAFFTYLLVRHALIRKRLSTWIVVGAMTTAVLLLNVLDLQKAPVVWISAGIGLTVLFTLPRRAQLVALAALSVIVLIFALSIVALVVGVSDRPFLDVVRALFDRLLVGGITPAYFYLDAVPVAVPFLDGSSLPNPRGLLPWDPFPYTRFFHEYMSPQMHARGITGSAPTAFWAELFINFGYPGILIITPAVGFLLGLCERVVRSTVPEPVRPALLAWLTLHFMKLAETGLGHYILDEKLVTVLILAMIIIHSERGHPGKPSTNLNPRSATAHTQCHS